LTNRCSPNRFEQVLATESFAEIPGAKLGYWDTSGSGEPILMLHPASGSALIWLYQQPEFAKAGYRVIAYSRRNYYNSDSAPANNPGTGSGDLQEFANLLGLEKFHVVSSAAGGSVAADYALSHPERLLSPIYRQQLGSSGISPTRRRACSSKPGTNCALLP
jgi:pimeloyl-ACP methyl ester carboxylesterase